MNLSPCNKLLTAKAAVAVGKAVTRPPPAQIATQHISNDLIKLAAGIATGLLVGIGVGVVMQRIGGRFVKTSAENYVIFLSSTSALSLRVRRFDTPATQAGSR